MKNKKIIAFLLALTLMSSLVGCKKEEVPQKLDQSTTTTTTTTTTTEPESSTEESSNKKDNKETTTKKKTETTTKKKTETTTKSNGGLSFVIPTTLLEGTWGYAEYFDAKELHGDFYNPEITKTNLKIASVYNFDGRRSFSFHTYVAEKEKILNEARRSIEAVYKPYLEDGTLTQNQYEDKCAYAITDYDSFFRSVEQSFSGIYSVNNEINTITYTLSNGQTFSEYFTLNGNKLTMTGSSLGNEGYPITYTKA